jgi:D-alanyl-D-alanine dipeptidase
MWKLVPDSRYVANPATGSNHNRGAAIDVTLADESGNRLEMPTGFDAFGPAAHQEFECPPSRIKACENRDLLYDLLHSAGLSPIPTEWWHFQLPRASKLPLLESIP